MQLSHPTLVSYSVWKNSGKERTTYQAETDGARESCNILVKASTTPYHQTLTKVLRVRLDLSVREEEGHCDQSSNDL